MKWWRLGADRPSEPHLEAAEQPNLDQAWKILSLVIDWLRHAEAKLGVILVFTGVSAGMLFNLVKEQAEGSVAFNIAAAICCLAAVSAGILAMIGLLPVTRLKRKRREEKNDGNPLYFHNISRTYKKASAYVDVLSRLTTSPDDLVRHIGQQVHANAAVASRKYRFASWAAGALLVDLLTLGMAAAITALGW